MASLLLGSALALQAAPDPEAFFNIVRERFTPTKPSVVMTYSVSYRLMGLRLFSIATATIEVREGTWHNQHTGRAQDANLVQVTLKSNRTDAEARKRGRVYIHDRIVSVSVMPTLNTLYYIKRTDEFVNPPFMRGKRVDNLTVYDLEDGQLDFLAHDYLEGVTRTNLVGAIDMAAQGKEVSRILTMIADVYHGRSEPVTPASDFRIHVNCDGVAVPFSADTSTDTISALNRQWPVLRADVVPAPEAPPVNNRDFSMWATSFDELARQLEDPALEALAADVPSWSMAPLMADYSLTLGRIRAAIVGIRVRCAGERGGEHLVTRRTRDEAAGAQRE